MSGYITYISSQSQKVYYMSLEPESTVYITISKRNVYLVSPTTIQTISHDFLAAAK